MGEFRWVGEMFILIGDLSSCLKEFVTDGCAGWFELYTTVPGVAESARCVSFCCKKNKLYINKTFIYY